MTETAISRHETTPDSPEENALVIVHEEARLFGNLQISEVNPSLTDPQLAILRASTATAIKADLEPYARLASDERLDVEYKKRGEYAWKIVSSLGMLPPTEPKDEAKQIEAFQIAFKDVDASAQDLLGSKLGDLLEEFEDHPAMAFVDTLRAVTSRQDVVDKEIVMLRRTLLVFLDAYGR